MPEVVPLRGGMRLPGILRSPTLARGRAGRVAYPGCLAAVLANALARSQEAGAEARDHIEELDVARRLRSVGGHHLSLRQGAVAGALTPGVVLSGCSGVLMLTSRADGP